MSGLDSHRFYGTPLNAFERDPMPVRGRPGRYLYAAGDFDRSAGGVICRKIARFSGSSWGYVGQSEALSGMIFPSTASFVAMAPSRNGVLLAGDYNAMNVGGTICRYLALWNGEEWSDGYVDSLGLPPVPYLSLTSSGSTLIYAGTNRVMTTADDGLTFTEATSADLLASQITQIIKGPGDLIYVRAGFVPGASIYYWSGYSWVLLPSPFPVTSSNLVYWNGSLWYGTSEGQLITWNGVTWASKINAVNGIIYALAVVRNNLYFGGAFTSQLSASIGNVCQYVPGSFNVIGVGSLQGGVAGIMCMIDYDGALVVGGDFETIWPGIPSGGLARWSGFSWDNMAGGMDNSVPLSIPRVELLAVA